jgi:hypothetical protein
MSALEFDDLGQPLCERCMQHWRRDTPLFQHATYYFTRHHQMNGH